MEKGKEREGGSVGRERERERGHGDRQNERDELKRAEEGRG